MGITCLNVFAVSQQPGQELRLPHFLGNKAYTSVISMTQCPFLDHKASSVCFTPSLPSVNACMCVKVDAGSLLSIIQNFPVF